MYADTQTGQVGDEDNPTVAVRLVGYVFPLQYQPENNGGEQGGESVYFAFYGREPECVTECINQCTDQSATHHCDKLSFGDIVFVSDNQFAYQMGDAPEKEQNTGATHEGTHVIHHFSNSCYVGSKLRKQIRH